MIRNIVAFVVVSALGYVIIDAQVPGMCTLNGQMLQQGQTYSLNCTSLCTCDNAATNHIVCRAACMDFSSLPRECYLAAPLPGRCCPQPKCPPTVSIQIPPQYQSEYPTIVG